MHSLLGLLVAQFAFATSFYIRPFSEFTQNTPHIIYGTLSNIHVENGVTTDGGKTIYTFADLEIKEVLKGNISGSKIIIRKLGGSKDGVTLEIPSSVRFKENESAVFFLLNANEDQSYEVTGMELGKFNLIEKNGQQILTGGIFSYTEHNHNDHQNADHQVMAENKRTWSLQQLKNLIETQSRLLPESTASNAQPLTSSTPFNDELVDKNSFKSNNQELNQTLNVKEKINDTPLYFRSSLWYLAAALIITLGVFFYIRGR